MRDIRLYIDQPLAGVERLALPASAMRHVRVLRLAPGQAVTLFNGDGADYAGVLEGNDGKTASVRLHARRQATTESPLRLTLVQALARGERMDWVVQKATELGVTRIVPVTSERTQVQLAPARARKRRQHWQAVASAACEQCGRAVVPDIEGPRPLEAWLAEAQPQDAQARLALVPGATCRVRELPLHRGDAVIAVVGPEGGFGARDRDALQACHFTTLTLGPRTLRTETAGPALLAALQACHGDG